MLKSVDHKSKSYGFVFNCFSTRAIHLKLAASLDTDAFINAFIRFVLRRGAPHRVWSDNGTTSVGHAELKRCLQQVNHDSIVQTARRQNVDWTFYAPLASHHECGSVWSESFTGYCLHSWLPHRLWQRLYCTRWCTKLKIWLTVGH